MKTEPVKLSQLQVNEANPRIIKNDKFTKLVNSLLDFPKMLEIRPIVVDSTLAVLGGNMRLRALTAIAGMTEDELKARLSDIRDFKKKTDAEQEALIAYWERWQDNPTVPVTRASDLSDAEKKAFIIKDNLGYGEWDYDMLANDWDMEDLVDWGLDVWNVNEQQEKDDENGATNSSTPDSNPSLADRFVVPPFSVLDTRRGYWQGRKKKWHNHIGDTLGESREGKLVHSIEFRYKDLYCRSKEHRKKLGIPFKEYIEKYVPREELERERSKVCVTGVSLFDPVLAEIMCKWFTPEPGAKIFDCFAGDTQKGFVFGTCGYEFTGIELRQEQVDINNRVIADKGLPVRYICDDGQNVANHFESESQDLLFSCPPYYNLEKYSDLENDASNQGTYEEFIQILDRAFKSAVGCLKENRFAVIVVGDVRNKATGCFYDFCGDVKRIFTEAGMPLYNELILVESGATAALRAAGYMRTRKVAKNHQNVLVFYKGNTRGISKTFKKIEFTQDELSLFAEEAGGDDDGDGLDE